MSKIFHSHTHTHTDTHTHTHTHTQTRPSALSGPLQWPVIIALHFT